MVSATSMQQPYLASATSLIKALKSARDPPQPDWPLKIEIATQAWQRKDQIGHGLGGRIGDVIREWLLECWLKNKGAKGAKNDLLHAAHHDLLRSIVSESRSSTINGISTTHSHQFLTAFLHALRLSPELVTEELLLSASRLFNTLFGHSVNDKESLQGGDSTNGVLVKAENWLETLGGLIAWSSYAVDVSSSGGAGASEKPSTLQFDVTSSDGLRSLAELIVVEMNASLVISQNRRKITLNSIKPLVPTYLKVLRALPLVRKPLETLIGPLFWPLAVLQPQTQSSQASSSESLRDPAETVLTGLVFTTVGDQSSTNSASDTLAILSFLPALSKEYVAALQANRYAIFPPPSASSASSKSRNASSVPPDVYVGDKVRQAVQIYVRIVTQSLEKIELGLGTATAIQRDAKSQGLSAKSASAQEDIRLEIWATRYSLWQVVKNWGGYFEGDEGWRLLVTDTVAGAAQWLSTSGLEHSLQAVNPTLPKSVDNGSAGQPEQEIYGHVEKLFSTLLELDYGACKVDADTEGKVLLAASLLNGTSIAKAPSSSPIHAILRYHALTQSVPDFAVLLISAIQFCFSSTLTSTMTQRDIYRRLASGPLISPDFRRELEKALNGTFVGGISEERGWGSVVAQLGKALRDNMLLLGATEQQRSSQTEAPSKRRRKNDGRAAPVTSTPDLLSAGAGTFAILSRVMSVTLQTAYGKGQGYEKHGKAEDVLRIIDLVSKTWREDLPSPASEEVTAGILLLRKAEELLRREAVPKQSGLANSHGEVYFEQASLQMQTFSILESPDAQPLSGVVDSLAPQESHSAWSGAIVDVNSSNSHVAMWHLVAQRGLTVIEENATEKELDLFCQSLLNSIPASRPAISSESLGVEELLATQAIDRVIKSAEFWELGRIRSAILNIVQKAIDDKTSANIISIISLLLQAPLDFLTKTVRTAAIKRTYEIDAGGILPGTTTPLTSSEQELLRRFMVKVIRDTEQVGPLSEPEVLMRLIKEHASSSDGVQHATQELISIAVSALLKDGRTTKTQQTLKDLIDNAQKTLTSKGSPQQARWFTATRQLFQSAFEQSVSLSPELTAGLTQLSETILDSFTSQLRPKEDALFTTNLLDTTQRVGVLCAVTRYRAQISLKATHRDLANTLCVRAMTVWNETQGPPADGGAREEAACTMLGWAIVQSDSSSDIVDMKAFLSIWSAFAALLGQSELLESQLRNVFATCSGTVFEALLAILATVLEREVQDSKGVLIPSLRALAVVSSLSIPQTGRIYRATLARILSALRRLLEQRDDAEVQLQCLHLLEIISSEKTVILVHQDVSDMLAICHSATLPRPPAPVSQAPPSEGNVAHPHLAAILATVGSLVRHRRDLVINVLPQLMKLYARILELFGTPRTRSSIGGSEERVKRLVRRQWPIWLSGGLNEEDARAFARALETLISRTTIRSTSAGSDTSAGTMIGQLSKHAPVLLIAYVRAVAHPLSTIPAPVRHQLVPGIGAMCEAVVAGGKAMLGGAGSASGSGGASENRTAESIGEAFGLGEGAGGEGELIVWGEMWRAWRRSRYVGQG